MNFGMTIGRPAITAVVALAVVALTLAGCTSNPATGEQSFTAFMSAAEEVRIGRQEHPKILKTFGGAYSERGIAKYVDSVGQILARTVERRDLKFTFTVVNSDIVNAFAMPGGYVYVSRGLIALAGNEAELAGVLAHELGHITARHHAQRYSQATLAGLGLAILGAVAGDRAISDLGGTGAELYLKSFSRSHEHQSDELGIRYLARAGYDPGAMASFLKKLQAKTRLQAMLRGESSDAIDQFNYFATHPPTADRIGRVRALAAATRLDRPRVAWEVYHSKIEGLLYGDDPKQGVIKGRVFAQPELRFRFEVPPGFRLFNSPAQVVAFGPQDARIVFDRARRPSAGPVQFYMTQIWAKNQRVRDLETITINGLEAATATTRVPSRSGDMDVRLLAVRVDLQNIYRFLFITRPDRTQRHSLDFRQTTYSFRVLTPREARAIKPLRVHTFTARPGATPQGLAEWMPYEDFRLERFEVLNGLARGERLAVGRPLKTIVDQSIFR